MLLQTDAAIGDVASWSVVAASLSLVVLAIVVARWLGLGVEGRLIVASVRAAVQLIAVGLLFTVIFDSGLAMLFAWVWIGAMCVIATAVVVRRAEYRVHGLLLVAGAAVVGSAAMSLGVTFGFGVLEYEPVAVVVIAGITIGNAVPSAALASNLSVALCRDRIDDLEAALALGFDQRQVMRFMAPRAAKTAFIPQIERTKVVGLIALPGSMTGLLLAGVEPLDAVLIQILVMYLVLGTTALCVVAVVAAVARAATTRDLRAADWTRAGAAPDA